MLWRFYERFKLIPPEVNSNFNKNTNQQVALMFAYEQIRQYEEVEKLDKIASAGMLKRFR